MRSPAGTVAEKNKFFTLIELLVVKNVIVSLMDGWRNFIRLLVLKRLLLKKHLFIYKKDF